MKISVIIPTYQPGAYIWECLDSLYAQTIGFDRFEVLVVLNGCEEPYLTMLRDGMKRYAEMNVRVLHTTDKGVSNARNFALREYQGDYVCFIDDDDWVSTTYLESLLNSVPKNGVAVSNVLDFNEETGETECDYLTHAFKGLSNRKGVGLYKGRRFLSSSCCKIIPRAVLGNGRFDARFAVGEDALFMAGISKRIDVIVPSDDDAIYYRRLRKQSASRRKRTRWQIFCNSSKLSLCYLRIWLSDVFHNNALFLLSRIVAVMHWVLKG